jgi:TetR/AcrR family transcriptional regulator, tetracycline repressor protein
MASMTSPRQLRPEPAPACGSRGRTRLTKAAVADQALRLADAAGLDALTLRKLAQELGVTPTALYWHFQSKDELLSGLADRVWTEVDTDVEDTAPWPTQLRGLLESLLRVLRAHPAAADLLLHSKKQGQSCLRVAEVTLEILRRAGFDPRYASETARSALWAGLMLVASEPGKGSPSAEGRAESQRRQQIVFATLPVSRYPRLVECAVPMAACDDPDFHYELGVSAFIAGVEATAARVTR